MPRYLRKSQPNYNHAEIYEPDAEWLKTVKTLADRYGETYGVRRDNGVFVLEFAKPNVAYALVISPSKENNNATEAAPEERNRLADNPRSRQARRPALQQPGSL